MAIVWQWVLGDSQSHMAIDINEGKTMNSADLKGKLRVKEFDKLKAEGGKTLKKSDGGGLYIFVLPSGVKTWYFIFSYNGKQQKLRIGNYPAIDLQAARARAVELKSILAQGKNPSEEIDRQAKEKKELEAKNIRTLDCVFQEWFSLKHAASREGTKKNILKIKNYNYCSIIDKKITEITQDQVLDVIRSAERRASYSQAKTIAQMLNKVFEFAKLRGYVDVNIAENLTKLLETRPKEQNHYAAIVELPDLQKLLNRLDCSNFLLASDNIYLYAALNLLILLGCRVNELLGVQWSEIDLENKVLTIPAARMKCRKEHKIYLSTQTMRLFELLNKNKQSDFVFCGNGKSGHLSDRTLRDALKEYCFINVGEGTLHGFRATLESVALNLATPKELIDAALSHSIGNQIFQAYLRTQALAERMRHFWQWWADTIDAIKHGKKPIKWHE